MLFLKLKQKSMLVIKHTKKANAKLPIHWLLAFLVALHGVILLKAALPQLYELLKMPLADWLRMKDLHELLDSTFVEVLFMMTLSTGLIINAIGLALRARTAWFMSLFLLLGNVGYELFYKLSLIHAKSLNSYLFLLIFLLVIYSRRFNQSSVLSGTLFAALGVFLLLSYSIFGTLYLGKEYTPPITNLSDAFYFSVVAMSTVGFGDIVPHSVNGRLFTTSIIILGITLFATSVSAVIVPLIQKHIQHLMKDKHHTIMKKNHIIIIGISALAQSVYAALHKAGHDTLVIIPPDANHDYPADTDLLVGDATDTELLRQAGVANALYVLALHNDDAENAFIVLASKEVAGKDTRTVALVNTPMHINKIKQVNPDVVLSLQSLGAEILARLVTGEAITDDLISQLLFPLEKKKS